MRISFVWIGIWGGLCLWALSCAQPRFPTGGEKDTIPPILLYSIPEEGQLNYLSPEILLVFDEWIGQQDLRSKLLLTPQSEPRNPYRASIRKNRLLLSFEEPLDSNTTYTLNFVEGITDLTEQNPIKNLSLSFSTGAVIDSLSLSGQVRWAETGKEELEALLYLVSAAADSLHFTQKPPIYISRSHLEGNFRFSHLAEGKYRLWAFVDQNKNQVLELQQEAYAFVSDTITLSSTRPTQAYPLYIVQIDGSEFICLGERRQNDYYEVLYNKELQDYELSMPQDTLNEPLYSYIPDKKKSIRFYKNSFFSSPMDSIEVHIQAQDLQHNIRMDTFFLGFGTAAFEESIQRKKEKKRASLFQITDEDPQQGHYQSDTFSLVLIFPLPIRTHHLDSAFYLYQDSLKQQVSQQKWVWNHNLTRLRLQDSVPLGAEQYFSLDIPQGSFIDVLGDSSSHYLKRWTQADPTAYGSVSGKVITESPHFLLELINSQDLAVQQLRNVTHFSFPYVSAGEYRFRLTEDTNQNAKWDPGNILKNIPPEFIYMPDTLLSIKQNWTLEHIELTFSPAQQRLLLEK